MFYLKMQRQVGGRCVFFSILLIQSVFPDVLVVQVICAFHCCGALVYSYQGVGAFFQIPGYCVFVKVSKIAHRLNVGVTVYYGFYVMLVENRDDLISFR